MFIRLNERTATPELMDDVLAGGEDLRKAFRHLRLLNRIFGASAPALYGVKQLWRSAGKPRRLTILDVGAGSGDVNRLLLKWADAHRIELRVTLVDQLEEACAEAEQLFRGEPRVEVKQCSLFDMPHHAADIVTGTQFVHHFDSQELPRVIGAMLNCSRIGVVINDLHRHIIPWTAVWITTRLVSRNRYIRVDGPLSVAKGFRANDWHEISRALETDIDYSWRPLFRYAVTIRKHR